MLAHWGPAHAWNSASNLSGYCSTLIEELDKGVAPLSYRSVVCVTYFQGVGDALTKQAGANPASRCMADRYLNLDDLRHPRIFQEYLAKHPGRLDDVASDVIRDALEEACRQ
ncbi:Rap1a/Tai family immunity protein [Bradyrhizobium guangdongense]|uniref:Rap1a/Tai family immunity protein n=1 Tax=Bradyrhizobium guangdongense TaxID=1325090 RepID=UPI001FF0026C|nr:Rap1a/Tai family immunity protein [Bradyrhizobium guangdongense]